MGKDCCGLLYLSCQSFLAVSSNWMIKAAWDVPSPNNATNVAHSRCGVREDYLMPEIPLLSRRLCLKLGGGVASTPKRFQKRGALAPGLQKAPSSRTFQRNELLQDKHLPPPTCSAIWPTVQAVLK